MGLPSKGTIMASRTVKISFFVVLLALIAYFFSQKARVKVDFPQD